jgi:putative transcriptional regulator
MRLRVLIAASALLAAAPRAPGADDPRGLRPGIFLYASPELLSPSFTQSVVLLVEHGPDGSLGLIVNRPSRTPVREALPKLPSLDLALYFGGPVQLEVLLGLVRSPRPVPEGKRVLPDVYFCGDLEPLEEAARAPDAASRVRVYAGYAGWSAGQLTREVREGSWVLGPADARSVFSPEPEALWPRVHDLLRRIEVRLDTGGAREHPRASP